MITILDGKVSCVPGITMPLPRPMQACVNDALVGGTGVVMTAKGGPARTPIPLLMFGTNGSLSSVLGFYYNFVASIIWIFIVSRVGMDTQAIKSVHYYNCCPHCVRFFDLLWCCSCFSFGVLFLRFKLTLISSGYKQCLSSESLQNKNSVIEWYSQASI